MRPVILASPVHSTSISLLTETTALLAALSGSYSTNQQIAINNLISSLKTAGVWAKLDTLQIYALANSTDARFNWKTATSQATLTGSPSFTAYSGFSTSSTANYIITGFNPTSGTPLYAQNNASFGVWINSNIYSSTGTDVYTLTENLGALYIKYTDNKTYYGMNHSVGSYLNSTLTSWPIGLYAVSRSDSTGQNLYTPAETNSTNSTSAALYSATYELGRYMDAPGRTFSAFFAGQSLNQTEYNSCNSAIATFLGAIP